MINRLPWRKKLRTSAANNLDKINEIVDYINHSDISPVTLSDSATGRVVDVGMSSSMKGLEVFGESVQNGVPSPDAPVPIQVVKGRNLLENTATTQTINGVTFTVNDDKSITANGTSSGNINLIVGTMTLSGGSYFLSGCPSGGSWDTYCLQLTNNPVTTNKGIDSGSGIAVTVDDGDYLVRIKITNGQSVSNLVFKPQFEEGSTAHAYVPYGHIGLCVTADGETTVTPIPLPSKGFAASLPDGTRDVLTIDSAGRWEWVCAVGETVLNGTETWTAWATAGAYYTTLESGDFDLIQSMMCNNFVFVGQGNAALINRIGQFQTNAYTNGHWNGQVSFKYDDGSDVDGFKTWLAQNPQHLLYKINTSNNHGYPTIESGYIDVPEIPDGATVTIEATIIPEFNLDWWSYQDITDIITDLKEYTDWKVSQVEGASTLGNNRLDVNPVVKEVAEIGKIEDKEVPAEIEDEEVPEEIEDTEVE